MVTPLTLEESWVAVLMLAPDPEQWWLVPGVEWADVARAVGLSSRQAVYRFELLGWSFGGRYQTRVVLRAPCRSCGQVVVVGEECDCGCKEAD